MKINNTTIAIKLEQPAVQKHHKINKVIGTIDAKNFAKLVSHVGLTANPRKSKIGNITRSIDETLQNKPQMLVCFTKGLLISTYECKKLERNRFDLSCEHPSYEGVLDGGHNMLAIGLHILSEFGESPEKIRKIKIWDDFRDIWNDQDQESMYELLDSDLSAKISIPIEIVYPSEGLSEEDFRDIVFDISEARNNNVSLAGEAMDDHKGYYEILKKSLEADMNDKVEWKPNDKDKSINSKEIIAMSLIPLLALQREGKLVDTAPINPVNIYSSKGKCVEALGKIIAKERGKSNNDEIKNPLMISAFKMLKDLPRLFDLIYEEFPNSYNAESSGFGRISYVRMYTKGHKATKDTYLRNAPKTKYYEKLCTYKYPEGFILPIFCSLSAMMEVKKDELVWKVNDPYTHVKENLDVWTKLFYHSYLKPFDYDPQKVGKNSGAYMTMEMTVDNSIK